MDVTSLTNYFNDASLVSNYYTQYIRNNGAVISTLIPPSFDILKYKFIDETSVYTESNIDYLDKVSYEEYSDYTQTRNLYLVNSLIKDPIKTGEYTNFILVDRNKVLDTISKGVLFTPNRMNVAYDSFNISYIYDSMFNTENWDMIKQKVKSLESIMSNVINTYSTLTDQDEVTGVRYCMEVLMNQFVDNQSAGWYSERRYVG